MILNWLHRIKRCHRKKTWRETRGSHWQCQELRVQGYPPEAHYGGRGTAVTAQEAPEVRSRGSSNAADDNLRNPQLQTPQTPGLRYHESYLHSAWRRREAG